MYCKLLTFSEAPISSPLDLSTISWGAKRLASDIATGATSSMARVGAFLTIFTSAWPWNFEEETLLLFGEKKARLALDRFDRFARDQAVKKIECPYLHLWGVVEVCESVQFGKEESHGLSDVFNLRWNLVVTFPVKHAYKTSAESGRFIIGHP